ncbi:uncharacterized protein LOC121555864 isoform X2 [Coregonus clupeaformis]|uniref:uncharacterized protein LOC121555864 isoform X2 n=1 Tax=Coregonus clupeaformis TaxID=59861 RepID=UPI001BDFF083|nr:uncharacterized protein LOC121555864 isoform X2 [Coregonus clupeaformis]
MPLVRFLRRLPIFLPLYFPLSPPLSFPPSLPPLCLFPLFPSSIRMSSLPQPRHVIWETEELVAYLHPRPWTPGTTILEPKTPRGPGEEPSPAQGSLFRLGEGAYLGLLLGARAVGALLCERLGVKRCALVCRPCPDSHSPPQIRVLPLHGLDSEWRPHLAGDEHYTHHDPGYVTSKSGPRWTDTSLQEIQAEIRAQLPAPDALPNLTFLGEDPSHPGLFSRIVRGEEQQWRVWENEGHVAFLTPFPNAPGLTVLVPRRPLTSDIFRLEEADYTSLALATRKVARILEEGLGAWGVGLIFEGFEIDYAHAKLIPLLSPPSSHQVDGGSTTTTSSSPPPQAQFSATYPGFVTSEDGPEASLECLKELQAKITQ